MNQEQIRQTIEMLLSWFRVFLAAIVAQAIAGISDWSMLLNAGLAAVLPVILRWLDSDDLVYGRRRDS